MAVSFLGPGGSFSEVAAITFRPDDEMVPLPNFPAVVAAAERGEVTHAMLPIENSIEGAVSPNLDLLIHDTELKICAEIIVPVQHYLIAPPGARMEEITVVSSHPQALAQCRKYLEEHLPNATLVAALSTSGAVESVSQGGDRTKAAIGTARSAALYGGEILDSDIHDVRANVTRFVALSSHDAACFDQYGAPDETFTFHLGEHSTLDLPVRDRKPATFAGVERLFCGIILRLLIDKAGEVADLFLGESSIHRYERHRDDRDDDPNISVKDRRGEVVSLLETPVEDRLSVRDHRLDPTADLERAIGIIGILDMKRDPRVIFEVPVFLPIPGM